MLIVLKFYKNYIPLSLELTEKIVTIIVDDTLVGSERLGGYSQYPYGSFSLLVKLFSDKKTRKVFPASIQSILTKDFTLPTLSHENYLVGEKEQGTPFRCVSLDLSITDDSQKPVLFHDIKFFNVKQKLSFDCTLRLTAREAFLILGNILVSNQYILYRNKVGENNDFSVSLSDFYNNLKDYLNWGKSTYGDSFKYLNGVCFEYLKYLRTELLQNNLSPATILHYSGVIPLTFLRSLPIISDYVSTIIHSLENTEDFLLPKIAQYYTFLYNMLDYSNPSDAIGRFLLGSNKSNYNETVAKDYSL